MSTQSVFITGSAGFVGFHLARRLLAEGHTVVGLDNLNDYYPVQLKLDRNAILSQSPNYQFHQADLADSALIEELFSRYRFSQVYHLAAQAGVRYSLDAPRLYLQSNVDGTFNLLEAARNQKSPAHLVLASSSSVYGLSKEYPFREDQAADRPVSLYGATKRTNELMAHSYSHLFGLKVSMVRLFTVYGPWGRPDMALFKFVKSAFEGQEIEVFNHGQLTRDFTYVDDIVEGLLGLARARKFGPDHMYDVFNIGCAAPRSLKEFLDAIQKSTGRELKIKNLPHQPGDVHKTAADISKLHALSGYSPKVSLESGVQRFVEWYRDYHRVGT